MVRAPDTESYSEGLGIASLPRAAHRLWGDSPYEVQTVDTSGEMGEMARRLRQRKEEDGEREGEGETIPGVYFRQYLPTSNRVSKTERGGCLRGKERSKKGKI